MSFHVVNVVQCHIMSCYAIHGIHVISCWFLFYLLTAAWVVVVMQENPAISWHDQDPQLELKIPHLASHVSVHSLELHLSPHWRWASAQHRALIRNKCIKNIKKYYYNIDYIKAHYKKSRNLLTSNIDKCSIPILSLKIQSNFKCKADISKSYNCEEVHVAVVEVGKTCVENLFSHIFFISSNFDQVSTDLLTLL